MGNHEILIHVKDISLYDSGKPHIKSKHECTHEVKPSVYTSEWAGYAAYHEQTCDIWLVV